MPRIATALLRKARAIDPLLPALLGPCRDLQAARNELRWLREHVGKVAQTRRERGDAIARGVLLQQFIKQRARGKPLQYILGTEYFGDLEIHCRPGVLIPRQDTATSITHLVHLLRDAHDLPPQLRVLDLCTGSGCIPLLFQHEFLSRRNDTTLHMLGVDVSDKALTLAQHNKEKVFENSKMLQKSQMQLVKADILLDPIADPKQGSLPLATALNQAEHPQFWDILISNPPYISPSQYWKTTTRSVRAYEPKIALVPASGKLQDGMEQGDMFYPHLLNIARETEAKIVLLEVADMDQAVRVAETARGLNIYDGIEIWRDEPNASAATTPREIDGFAIIGEGNGRSVLCYRGVGTSWLNKAIEETSTAPTKSQNEESLKPSFEPSLLER